MGCKESLSKKTFVETFFEIKKEISDLGSSTKKMITKEKKLIKATEKLSRLIILIGGLGAGKSFFYNKLITDYVGSSDFVYLNRDDIISMIP